MAGSVTITEKTLEHVKQIKFAWTTDANGDVDIAITKKSYTGNIIGIKTRPASAPNDPTVNYDVVLNDEDGEDVLLNAGANIHNLNIESVQGTSLGWVSQSKLDLVVSNAGNAKQGTVYIYIA